MRLAPKNLPAPPPATGELAPPVAAFTSAGGRRFTVGPGAHSERFAGDALWSDTWPILFEGKPAGKLCMSAAYGHTKAGVPRFHATIRELYWSTESTWQVKPSPHAGIGHDVAAFDSADEAVAAWGRSADSILDWEDPKRLDALCGPWRAANGHPSGKWHVTRDLLPGHPWRGRKGPLETLETSTGRAVLFTREGAKRRAAELNGHVSIPAGLAKCLLHLPNTMLAQEYTPGRPIAVHLVVTAASRERILAALDEIAAGRGQSDSGRVQKATRGVARRVAAEIRRST